MRYSDDLTRPISLYLIPPKNPGLKLLPRPLNSGGKLY